MSAACDPVLESQHGRPVEHNHASGSLWVGLSFCRSSSSQSLATANLLRLQFCACPWVGMIPIIYIRKSSRNSDAGLTPVTNRWSRARVQAT